MYDYVPKFSKKFFRSCLYKNTNTLFSKNVFKQVYIKDTQNITRFNLCS